MKALAELKQGWEGVWDSLSQGWKQIRERTHEALTPFNPGHKNEVAGNPQTAGDPFPLRAPVWALLSGEVFEDDEQVVVRLEVPGLEKKDFSFYPKWKVPNPSRNRLRSRRFNPEVLRAGFVARTQYGYGQIKPIPTGSESAALMG